MTIAAPRTTPSGTQASSSGEIRGLTGLRIVAAVWVVAFHFHFTAMSGVTEVVGWLGPLITSGALGVDLFFVLSGFVIAHTYLASMGPALHVGPTVRFVWARFCRMWPVYALVFHLFGLWLLARLLLGSDENIAFQGVQPIMSVGQWVQQLLMVQMWNNEFLDGASWVGSTWSISAEWLAYSLFPVAALLFYRLRNLPLVVLAVAAVALMLPIASSYATIGSPYYAWSWVTRILCGFGAGVLVHLVVTRLPRTELVRRIASTTAWVLPLTMAVGLWAGQFVAPGFGGVVIVGFPVLVGALALADRGPAMVLSRPALVQGGKVSYSLYLVHIPMFEVFWLAQAYVPELRGGVVGHLAALAVIGATYPVAAAAFRWVEEPARRSLRRVGAPRPAVPTTVATFLAARESLPETTTYLPPAPRHAASPTRQPTLAAALVSVQRRRPTHRADTWGAFERAGQVRATILHAGSE
ncbi:acyltransferase [Pseudonocardia petroleophila]|uniref:acyltransferase family protein n=1 Tax=Pseudonocardia petroleophila TaxID=37331 RepID=UPI0021050636|nr:acyltransferase [Pseudonocardia petroleophila]